MEILLIYPPISADIPVKSTLLGLGYIASVLRDNGHKVIIKDCVNGYELVECRPDFVGISAMFTDYKQGVYDVIKTYRQVYPNAHIIVGGAHASTFPDEMAGVADTVVVGEGEPVINNIVSNRLKGIIYSKRITNLDTIPMPAWDLMLPDIRRINELSKNSPFLMRTPIIHISTSRGCPNNCTFCAVKTIWGRNWYAFSAKYVVNEIAYLHLTYGFKEFHIVDDNCSIDRFRLLEICDEIIRRGLNVKIATPTGIQIKNLDKLLLRKMKQAGFYRLCFGIESGDPYMQMSIKKHINLRQAVKTIRYANRLGFWTSATFILGFPDELGRHRENTLKFAKQSGLDFAIFYQLNPQAKTEVSECIKIDTSGFYKRFLWYKLLSPITYLNLIRKIKSLEDLRYMIRLCKIPIRMVFKRRLDNEGVRGR